MVTAMGVLALVAVFYVAINYRGSRSRELDQLIALEDRAELLRKRSTFNAQVREKNVRARNRTMLKIAQKRRELVRARKVRAADLNRMVVARRRSIQA